MPPRESAGEREPRQEPDPHVEIRPMRRTDVPAILSLERVIYPAPWRSEHFERIVDLPGGMGWVATVVPGEIVGYAVGWVVADEAELANIAVSGDRRRSGIGARLLEAVRGAAIGRGARRLYLEVRDSNHAAQDFYVDHGFTVVGRRPRYYNRPTEDALVMAVDLTRGRT